jgi:hypothetical protein
MADDPGLFRGGIAPLLWHHGEPPERMREEIAAIRSAGIEELVLEPRPHPDYLGPRWWADAAFVVEEVRRRGMRMWFFDDGRYPSGWAGGRIAEAHPELLKRYLAERHLDVVGPLPGASVRIRPWLEGDDRLVAVVAARRDLDADVLVGGSLVDLTDRVHDGVLYWDLPAGPWRVHVLVVTRRGGEQETREYVNPVDPRSASAVLALVHEEHRARFGADFGGVIRGFFQDEPRFGNSPTYDAVLGARTFDYVYGVPDHPIGNHEVVLPWAPGLLEDLAGIWHGPVAVNLPLLWFAAGEEETARFRHAFMDLVSRRFASYLGELGDWCRSHGLMLIGHLVEDNGAHARHGYGPGHYFRAIGSQDAAGIDVVHQLHPGHDRGRSASPFGYLRNEFFFWGLAKLASSAAHLDSRMAGRAMCEAFGAYGWHAGLRTMTWVTDHLLARGVNAFVPHAFSPRADDPDCPPHFYDGGANPQWRHFGAWSGYTRRATALLSGGVHRADAAVLYHAEAEWAGPAQPFEELLGVLARRQLDADVIPADELVAAADRDDGPVLRMGAEEYPALVMSRMGRLPAQVLDAVGRIAARGVPVLVVDALPAGSSTEPIATGTADRLAQAEVVALDRLAERLSARIRPRVRVDGDIPMLRVLSYQRPDGPLWFLFNEDVRREVAATLRLAAPEGHPVLADLMTETEETPPWRAADGEVAIELVLAPGESRVLRFAPTPRRMRSPLEELLDLTSGTWDPELGPMTAPTRRPGFAGVLRYRIETELPPLSPDAELDLGDVGETAEVRVDGVSLGVRIRHPYRFAIGMATRGGVVSRIEVDVTTTRAHAAGDNVFDRAVALEPDGLLGPVVIRDAAVGAITS